MDGVAGALLTGTAAGLGVAVPLGPVGVLLVREAMTRGRGVAVAASAGVATVDLTYAVLAVTAGTAVSSLLAGHERRVRLFAAAVLVAVALHGLLQARRDAVGPARGADDAPGGWGTRGGAFLRFVGLTLVNPLTALYFVALAAGAGDRVGGPARMTAFVAGVAAGSWAWQLVLVAVGTLTGGLVGPRARRRTAATGSALVLLLAVSVLLVP